MTSPLPPTYPYPLFPRLFIYAFCFLPLVSTATTLTGSTGDWEAAGTWTPSQTPTCGDSMVIPAGDIITVTAVNDYYGTCVSPAMQITIYGTLKFQTGKRLKLPCGSVVYVMAGGLIDPGIGGGSSNTIEICGMQVWTAGYGPVTGPVVISPSSPLPITLVSFFAGCNNNVVELAWVTASEINNDYFTVERSTDGINFETVAIVDGAGNSTQTLIYFATDENPYNGISYYHLKQTDFDNKFTYSWLVAVNCSISYQFGLAVFPNPSNGENTFIEISGEPEKEVLVVVYNTLGEETYSKVLITESGGSTIFAIDKTGKLTPGVYIVTASSAHRILKKKLIIE